MKGSYIGSVRFYKNLILAVIVLLIGLGFGCSAHYHHRLTKTEDALSALQDAAAPYLSQDGSGSVELSSGDDLPYQALYPDFYAPQAPATTTQDERTVYLTFDGGPTSLTEDLLGELQVQNVKATFFVTGVYQENDAVDLLNTMVADGHSLGMLSWSDDYGTVYSSVESYLADMYQLFSYIKEATGVTPTIFRFPGGSVNSYNAGIYRELVAEMLRRGFVPFDWNISSQDQVANDSTEVSLRVISLAQSISRSIVLMHDTDNSIDALGNIVDELSASGYTFAPLDEHVKPILFSYR